MKGFSSVLLILLISLFVSGCSSSHSDINIVFSEVEPVPASTEKEELPPVRVAISSVLSPSETIKHYRKIADYIGKQLDRPAILIQRKSYNEIGMLMMNDGADIALFSSGAYVTYNQVEGIEAIAMQERMGVPYYYGYLVVNQDSNITNISQLKGKSVAIADPSSNSSYLFLSEKLAEFGETPEHFFSGYTYTYNHEKSLNAVRNRVVDASALSSSIYEQAKAKDPKSVASLRILDKSRPLGTGPVVINSSIPEEEKKIIMNSFFTMHKQSDMKQALEGLFIDCYVPFDAKYWDGL